MRAPSAISAAMSQFMGFDCMVNSQKEARRGAGQKGLRGSAFAPNSQLITGYQLRHVLM